MRMGRGRRWLPLDRGGRQVSRLFSGRVAKIFGIENYAPSIGALRSDRGAPGPSNRSTYLVEVGGQGL